MTNLRKSNDRLMCAVWFAVCTLLLFYGSLVPFRFRSISLVEAADEFSALFHFPVQRWGETADWSLNVTIMVPIAFFALGAIIDGRDRRLAWLMAPPAVLACLAISFAVEFAQVWCVDRVASIRDIVAQALGASIGVAVWLVAGDRYSAWRRSFAERREPQQRLEWMLQAYVVGLAIYSVIPLDLVMSPGELAQKYRSGLIELVPFTYGRGGGLTALYSMLKDVLLFVPVGMCAASAWNRHGRLSRPIPQALMIGLLYTAGLEAAQLLVVGRYTSSTDVVLGFAGVAMGVFLMRFWRRESRAHHGEFLPDNQNSVLWLFGALVYTVILAAVFWAPYRFTNDVELVKTRLDAFFEVPFVRMHEGSDAIGMFAAIRKVLWFLPLGALCGMAVLKLPLRTQRALVGLAVAAILAVALFIELGQVLLPDRVADSTDALLMAGGGVAGLWATITVAR